MHLRAERLGARRESAAVGWPFALPVCSRWMNRIAVIAVTWEGLLPWLSGGSASRKLLLFGFDLDVLMFDVEAQAIVNVHIYVADPYQGE